MSLGISYMLAQTFSLSGALHVADIVDQDGTRTAYDLNGGTTERYYCTKLCAAGSGTLASPYEFVARMQFKIRGASNRWHLSMLSSGKLRLSYTGTGTGTITWGASCAVGRLLGFTSNVSIASGGTQTADYHPTHVVYAVAADDQGWQTVPGRTAAQTMPDRTVYGWQDGLGGKGRVVTLKHAPRDHATRVLIEAEQTGVVCGTPAFGLGSRVNAPAAGDPGQVPPWGINDTLATACGKACGWTDDFAGVIAGTVTVCDKVYLEKESFDARSTLSVPGYDKLRDYGPLQLAWVGEVTL